MLKTPPNQGTYYPPKCMLDGQWKYLVGVTEWHDHEHDAQEAHRLQARIEELEASETRLIEERDSYHDWADRLANAIAAHVGEGIGEHTSANSPWANALELIEAETEELPANSDL